MQQEPTIPQNTVPDNASTESIRASKKRNLSDGWKGAFSTISILVAAPLVAVALTTFVFQSYEVDGPSMETTLQNRDRLIVWKAPKTIARITKKSYIPKRGEIVVFVKHSLSSFGEGNDKQLIKRIVGLPGERLVVREGIITIYNKEHPEGFNPDTAGDYKIQTENTAGNVDITIPDNEVFIAGDNRPNSLDSRAFGTIKSEDIVGELALRIFPFNKAKGF